MALILIPLWTILIKFLVVIFICLLGKKCNVKRNEQAVTIPKGTVYIL